MNSFHQIMTELTVPATFYFVRHGESAGNVEGKMQGHRDHPLTELGRRQALDTGHWFADTGVHVDRVFSSPLARAAETAEILADTANFPRPEPLPVAMELHTGLFTGLSFPEIQEQFPTEYAEFIVGSWEAVPEAESVRSLTSRALETWSEVVSAANALGARGETNGTARRASVMTVTHGGMLQWIFKTSFGATPDEAHPWMPLVLASNCSIFEFTARPVASTDRHGSPTRWYYGQWSRVNFAPADPSSPGSVAREQFHTGGDQAR
ncbi:MAG: histidine phosphatase family protein, partial [Alkalispirochaeta sp.]